MTYDLDKSPDGYTADTTADRHRGYLRRLRMEQEHYLRSLQVLRAQLEWPPLYLYDEAIRHTPRLPGNNTLP